MEGIRNRDSRDDPGRLDQEPASRHGRKMTRLGLSLAAMVLAISLTLCGLALAGGAAQASDEFGFISSISGHFYAYRLDAGRGLLYRYDTDSQYVLRLLWSPDGEQIALTMCQPPRFCSLWLYDQRGSPIRLIKENTLVLDWSPDGARLLVHDLVTDPAPYSLTLADERMAALGDGDLTTTFPVWSPIGDEVAYVGYRRGSAASVLGQIYRTRPGSIAAERLTFHPGHDNDPQWSPDGTRIAFISSDQPAPAPDLYIMNRDGTDLHRVTELARVYYHTWSPDGTHIAFINAQPTRPQLYLLDVSDPDARPVLLADGIKPIAPLWSGDSLYYVGVDSRLYRLDTASGLSSAVTFAPIFGAVETGRVLNLRP
jgi:Tol biopolymer transport system component